MCETKKPRFRVDEPVYVKMTGYQVKGYVKTIGKCVDFKDGVDREYFTYTVDDENGYQVYPDCAIITDATLVERWECKNE